jgi:hypothetical protein
MRSFSCTKLALRLSPATRLCSLFMEIHLRDLAESASACRTAARSGFGFARVGREDLRAERFDTN